VEDALQMDRAVDTGSQAEGRKQVDLLLVVVSMPVGQAAVVGHRLDHQLVRQQPNELAVIHSLMFELLMVVLADFLDVEALHWLETGHSAHGTCSVAASKAEGC